MTTSSEEAKSVRADAPAGEKKPAAKPARSEGAQERTRPWHDSWVTKLTGDGSEVPSLVGLFGYLGASPEPGRVRLYSDPQFTFCFEIDADGLAHRVAAPATYSPLGGSFVWITSAAWAEGTLLWRQH
jgi:hypothetical protein